MHYFELAFVDPHAVRVLWALLALQKKKREKREERKRREWWNDADGADGAVLVLEGWWRGGGSVCGVW